MTVEAVPIGKLYGSPSNPRKNDAAVDHVAASLQRFGWQQPIVAKMDGEVIAGNTRLKAAKSLGMTHVPVVRFDGDNLEATAFAVADNRTAEFAEWDDTALASILEELRNEDALDGIGFESDDIDRLIEEIAREQGQVDGEDDGGGPPPAEPVTRLGDLWICGTSKVLCGDSTKPSDVKRLMGEDRAGLVFTSPPYGQQRDYKKKVDDWDALMRGVFGNVAPVSTSDVQILVNLGMIHADGEWVPYWDGFIEWMREQGWRRFGWYVWDKITATFKANDGRPYVAHEWVFHFNKASVPCVEWEACKHAGEQRSVWGQRRPDGSVAELCTPGSIKTHKPPDTIARVQRETNNADESVRSHPARFPIAFAEHWLRTWPGDVYDPFLGSGTTLIAAHQLGRKCYGIEIAPSYVDVAVRRWEKASGLVAHLAGSDRMTFDEIAADRETA